uniref:Apolipoprotein L3 n=1 Tax=Castor canadensis TaxID=51338 RepID=A0A8C0XMM2_CASCN
LGSRNSIDNVIENLLDSVGRENLQLLLTEDEVWKVFVAEAELSRSVLREFYQGQHLLRDALEELLVDMAVEDKDRLQKEQQARERFLETFHQVKMELVEQIGKLWDLADKVEKVHRDCTISNLVVDSTSAASGVLSILGLVLAPVTAGGSLMLSATGIGLGAVATLTGTVTSILGSARRLSVEAEASHLLSTSMNKVKGVAGIVAQTTPRVIALTKMCKCSLKVIEKSIQAIKLAKANPRLVANAKYLMTSGRISARSTKQVEKAFGGTVLAMTKRARMMLAASSGFFLLMDVISLVKETKHLQEGTKTESAEDLRRQAEELERMLEELIQIQESL